MPVENTQPTEVIAKLLMITTRRVNQLAQEGVIPKAAHGRYQLVPAVQGYIKYLKDRHIGGDLDEGFVDARKERALLARQQREKLTMETDILRGTLILESEARAAYGRMVIAAKQALLALPDRLAQMMDMVTGVNERRDILEQEIRDALDNLGNIDLEALGITTDKPLDTGSADALEAAAETDGNGMGGSEPNPIH